MAKCFTSLIKPSEERNKMAKLSPVSKLKDIAAQMLNIKRDMQKELADIRKKISVLEDERKKISNYSLSRSDLLTAALANVDNLHNELVNKMREQILVTADRTHRKADFGDMTVSFLETVMKGTSQERMYFRLTGCDYLHANDTYFLYNHEEIKRTIKGAFESIGDTEWPECTPVPAADSLARLAEIDSEITTLHQREGELIAAANLEGIDIGQGYSGADTYTLQ